ncbi:unnamed protein product [Rhizoctonia solani]|uniref:Uncharacterized protein n=1 Tax=Rhizoctonia solani TaxID=456999 RepID=A0A8H3CLS5_9AGAM|nr:unnamed protein product [Rhizoctonia solani]
MFPRWVIKKESPQFQFLPKDYHDSRDRLCAEVAAELELEATAPPDDDDLRLSAAIPIILQTYHHHEAAANLPDPPTEMDMRIDIDGLVTHIPDVDVNKARPLKYCNINVTTTTADGFSFLIFPKFEPYERIREVKRALAAYSTGEYKDLIIIHCAYEYKRTDSSKNQAIMGMVSALYQRKTLNMRDHFVFGVFQDDTHYLQVVAAIWQKDYASFYKIGEYTLTTPITAVQFYLVLREIKQLSYQYYDDIWNSEASFYRAVRVNAPTNEWAEKSKPMQRIQENHEGPNGANGLDGSNGPNGPNDSGPLDDDEALHMSFESRGLKPTTFRGFQHKLAAVGELDRYERIHAFIQGVGCNAFKPAPLPMKHRSKQNIDISADEWLPLTLQSSLPPTPAHLSQAFAKGCSTAKSGMEHKERV